MTNFNGIEMTIDGLSWSLATLTDVTQLHRLWTELEKRSDCAFFLTWDWIGTWLSTTTGLSPLLLSVYDGPTVVALALFEPVHCHRPINSGQALMLHRSGDSFKDLITIEYNAILTDRLYTRRIESFVFDFLNKLRDSEFGGLAWQEIHVGLTTDSVAERAKASGLIVIEASRAPSWFVDLAALRTGGSKYLDTLSANTRYQIRRAMRMYQKFGPIDAKPARSVGEALEFLEELKKLHQVTWTQRGQPGCFASTYFEEFHRALLSRCVERGSVEIVRVTAGNHLIGQVYNFVHNGHVYAYQTGISYETDPKLKPGLVSHFACLERHLRNGAHVYDFMAGSARYKSNLGIRGPDLAYYIFRPKTFVSIGLALGHWIKNSIRRRAI